MGCISSTSKGVPAGDVVKGAKNANNVTANPEETPQQRALDMMMLGVHADLQAAMSKTKGMAELTEKVTPLLQGLERQYQDKTFIYRAKEAGPSLGDLAVYNAITGLKALKFDMSAFPNVDAVVQAVKASEVQWVRGTAVPIALIRGFCSALKESDAAANRWLEMASVPESVKAVLRPEIKAGAAADLASRWGLKASLEGQSAVSQSPEVSGKPVLTYFSGPGRAELARLAFEAGGVEYDCVRISPDDWPSIKSDANGLPAKLFGSMPVLSHGDFILAQSKAVAQYAADIGMNATKPPTVEQRCLDTMMMGAHADLQTAMYACLFGDDESKAKGKSELLGKVTPILQGIESFYAAEGPYLYSSEDAGPTLGDLVLFDVVTSPFPGLKALEFDLTPFSKVTRCVEACEKSSKGNLAAYLSTRGQKVASI
jgi:glutathione S-transferase